MKNLDPNIRKLAAIAYGEASTLDDEDEIGGIAFAVANRARAWGNKSIEELLAAAPNYTYAIDGNNKRYERFIHTTNEKEINLDDGMRLALKMAYRAWGNEGSDPSNGAYWWDGVDFKTNYKNHPKVRDGFHFTDPSHNIFSVPESKVDVTIHWKVRNKKTGAEVNSKVRGKYSYVWQSTAAYGKTIFWKHDIEYLNATGGKAYR